MRGNTPRLNYSTSRFYTLSEGFQVRKALNSYLSRGALGACRDIGQIAAQLGRSQAIAYDKALIHEKTKVIGLEGDSTGGLLIQQGCQPDTGCASASQVPHQEFSSNPGLHQGFHQEYMLSLHVYLRAEEDLG